MTIPPDLQELYDAAKGVEGSGLPIPHAADRVIELIERIASLEDNPKVGDCFVCGFSIWAQQGSITDARGIVHPICASRAELLERNRLLSDIALSALALKMNVELGATPPPLHALNRDLAAFQRRFGGIMEAGVADENAKRG